LTKSWAIVGYLYRWDHEHFDIDFENVCLLTNERIRRNQLTQLDYEFYRNLLNARYTRKLEQGEKRKHTVEKAKATKKAKIRNYTTIFEDTVPL
jgi:hypothetical protein